MMRAIIAMALSAACLAQPGVAQPVTKVTRYEFFDQQTKTKDKACLSALKDEVLPHFEGLKEVRLGTAPVMNMPDMPIAIYAGATFVSQYGDVRGAIVCEYRAGQTKVATISVSFEGRGLAGFKNSPLAHVGPEERRANSYSAELFE